MFQTKILKNKARVVLAPRQGTEAVTLLVMFPVGSRQESKEISGVSHFIEHLYFKGTTRRPNTQILSQELDKIGADFNAFTSKDYTGYYIKVAKDKIEVAFDILSDMLWRSLFASSEINRERGTIIEEMRMYKDNPIFYIDNLLEQIVYQGHELGRDIIGIEKTISSISRQQILNYRTMHYCSENMIIGVGGSFSQAKINKLLDKYFNKKLGRSSNSQEIKPFKNQQSKSKLKLQYKSVTQAQLALGFVGVGRLDQKYLPQLVLAVILGGNMSSRLFIKVRERMGLAYLIKSSIVEHGDNSLFYIEAGLKKNKIDSAYKVIIAELRSLKNKSVGHDELIKAKDYLKGKMALMFEDSSQHIYWLLRQYINCREIKTFEQMKKQLDKVNPEQVREVAKELFKEEKLNLAIIGPYKDSLYFNKLIKQQKI